MTVDIWSEFIRTLAFSWACFGIGVSLWHWRDWANRYGLQVASKGLMLLSPILLSLFGYRSTEAVRTAELIAQAVPVRHVADEIEPLVVDRNTVTTPGGTRIEYIRTNYGQRRGAGSVRVGDSQFGQRGESGRPGLASVGPSVTGSVPVPIWRP